MLVRCTKCPIPHHYDDAATVGQSCAETEIRPIVAHRQALESLGIIPVGGLPRRAF